MIFILKSNVILIPTMSLLLVSLSSQKLFAQESGSHTPSIRAVQASTTQTTSENSINSDIKIIERLLSTRVNPDTAKVKGWLDKMKQPESRAQALLEVTQDDVFFKITVKNFASRMSVRSEEVSAPLNDFSATVIGVTRDNKDARELLTGNYIYIANTTQLPTGVTIRSNFLTDIVRSNTHYQDIEANLYRLNLSSLLTSTTQQLQRANSNTTADLVDNPDPAGVLTSNTWGREHFIAGTNRRAVDYTLKSFLCTPIEDAADAKASDARIGRDVDRFPGGDHGRFLTSCKSCHTVMDGFRGAFAQWHHDGNFLIHGSLHPNRRGMSQEGIANKYNQNAQEFSSGYQTQDASWVNNALRGKNIPHFGWSETSPSQGVGAQAFGQLLAGSDRFTKCMAKRVFTEVCQRSQSVFKNLDAEEILELAQQFKKNRYNLRQLFISAASHPKCL
jgi:hypothetical protein